MRPYTIYLVKDTAFGKAHYHKRITENICFGQWKSCVGVQEEHFSKKVSHHLVRHDRL
jgi:hypothetical protein